jgi:hypothetical protein
MMNLTCHSEPLSSITINTSLRERHGKESKPQPKDKEMLRTECMTFTIDTLLSMAKSDRLTNN